MSKPVALPSLDYRHVSSVCVCVCVCVYVCVNKKEDREKKKGKEKAAIMSLETAVLQL